MEASSKKTLCKLNFVMNASWKNRRSHVKEFIRRCPISQNLKINNKEKQYIPPCTLSADRPIMKRINVDSLGPFKEDEDGYCYVRCVINYWHLY